MQMENDGRNDFDFLLGTWKVHHRTLAERLKGSTDWEEFDGDTVDRKILNGLGNMDENIIHRKTGPVHAISFAFVRPWIKRVEHLLVNGADRNPGCSHDWRFQGWARRILFAGSL